MDGCSASRLPAIVRFRPSRTERAKGPGATKRPLCRERLGGNPCPGSWPRWTPSGECAPRAPVQGPEGIEAVRWHQIAKGTPWPGPHVLRGLTGVRRPIRSASSSPMARYRPNGPTGTAVPAWRRWLTGSWLGPARCRRRPGSPPRFRDRFSPAGRSQPLAGRRLALGRNGGSARPRQQGEIRRSAGPRARPLARPPQRRRPAGVPRRMGRTRVGAGVASPHASVRSSVFRKRKTAQIKATTHPRPVHPRKTVSQKIGQTCGWPRTAARRKGKK